MQQKSSEKKKSKYSDNNVVLITMYSGMENYINVSRETLWNGKKPSGTC